MTVQLDDIRREVLRLAGLIGAAGYVLPTFGQSEDFARPHIEVDMHGYHLITVERGREISHETTQDLDNLLYLVFRSVTHQLASDHELAHRNPDQDFRRILFARQEELLGVLSPTWADHENQRHAAILAKHPFDDNAHRRVELLLRLKGEGHSPEEAERLATKAYPEPRRLLE